MRHAGLKTTEIALVILFKFHLWSESLVEKCNLLEKQVCSHISGCERLHILYVV